MKITSDVVTSKNKAYESSYGHALNCFDLFYLTTHFEFPMEHNYSQWRCYFVPNKINVLHRLLRKIMTYLCAPHNKYMLPKTLPIFPSKIKDHTFFTSKNQCLTYFTSKNQGFTFVPSKNQCLTHCSSKNQGLIFLPVKTKVLPFFPMKLIPYPCFQSKIKALLWLLINKGF